MPWKEKTMEENRKEFVERVLSHEKSKSALCKEYGISRPTGDKWIKRYQNGETMSDQSRAPFKTANRISSEMEQLIVERRMAEPAIGARKQRRMLINEGYEHLPCASTFNAVYKRNNLITPEASAASTPTKRFVKKYPNEMWQCDFKGYYKTLDGVEVHPLSVIDDYSRFCLSAEAMENEQFTGVKEEFKKLFKTYGMPFSILCDNGNPWGASQSGALTTFDIFMMEHGVLVMHIKPKNPRTQGKVERFNGVFKQERLKFCIPETFEDAQNQRNEYRNFYNHQRPHAALDYECPSEHYEKSEIEYREDIPLWDYCAEGEVRKIKHTGYLTFGGHGFYLSESMANKIVCVVPTEKDGIFDIVFRQFRIARLSLHDNMIISRRVYLRKGDPRD